MIIFKWADNFLTEYNNNNNITIHDDNNTCYHQYFRQMVLKCLQVFSTSNKRSRSKLNMPDFCKLDIQNSIKYMY